jgi:predicted ester cyclase
MTDAKGIAHESFRLIETGDAELAQRIIAVDSVNDEAIMTGQHTGIFNGIEPTGKSIAHKQVHIFTIGGGQITRHRAVRDDLGLLLQLGWKPGL